MRVIQKHTCVLGYVAECVAVCLRTTRLPYSYKSIKPHNELTETQMCVIQKSIYFYVCFEACVYALRVLLAQQPPPAVCAQAQ